VTCFRKYLVNGVSELGSGVYQLAIDRVLVRLLASCIGPFDKLRAGSSSGVLGFAADSASSG